MERLTQLKNRFSIVGNTPSLNNALEKSILVSKTDVPVLILGESGVGKEVFPKIIHNLSIRKHKNYIAVNCGAIPDGTIDSELFGHQKGAFTGAISDRKGYFEEADSGTIFLDEVADLPLSTQTRLLRILETGQFIKVGSSKVEKVNVRVVAATNKDILNQVKEGKFREDLYYRLNTVEIRIQPLRKRKEDIVILFRKFAMEFSEKYNVPPIRLDEGAVDIIVNYRWPGNIRQLKHLVEQIATLERERVVSSETLRTYLPNGHDAMVIYGNNDSKKDKDTKDNNVSKSDFFKDREIIYKFLFDIKKDISELKDIFKDFNKDKIIEYSDDGGTSNVYNKIKELSGSTVEYVKDKNINDNNENINVNSSLQDREKEAIKNSLHRNKGRRNRAAKELGISERTLYRKINNLV